MGASESTARPNRTNEEEEEEEERQRASDGSSIAAGAGMALAAVGVAAWGISRMFSENTEKKENEGAMTMQGNSSTNNNHGSGYELAMPGSTPTRITWYPPLLGCFKMNTDGSCRPNKGPSCNTDIDDSVERGPSCNTDIDDPVERGPSGYAGVLRDHRGKWVRGFHGFIGVSDCLTAEFNGIYKGLVLLDKLGLKEATLESDCESAVKWINQENNSKRRSPIIKHCWVMITECTRLVLKNKITVSHCSKKFNNLAHKLADMAREEKDAYKEITIIPDGEIKHICDQESRFA